MPRRSSRRTSGLQAKDAAVQASGLDEVQEAGRSCFGGAPGESRQLKTSAASGT